ncbi:MAG: radical SAM family heme chaperone HemW [Flintibacter sp.]|uniref:radical SAM family heme chaperone HemW n=1 Tax=Flintibacter sp. TaxID=1918624 RepID=UPI00267272F6|nr:radical SAM family heme chaperone HemW [Flintibacter sp.]MCI6149075.1 radical SAM family heme chaperone HemW [Flintibacter sp.]MDD7116788.1 radical SAM family heme chaperone HemW [Flintibacter sp.]MDY5038756.1 radical SAM family heme chaperone HemW [Lawsonibacter sp.]
MADKLGIYIHIPFCRSKCDYCDFYSLAGRDDRMDQYQKALLSHIRETAPLAQDFPVDTIYIGGGTPSYYGAKRLKELLGVIRKLYQVEKDAEVTVECNPDSVDVKSLKILRKAGVNRLSMGMQSANACELERIHRIHTPQQVNEAATAARKAGFTNLSLDLIYGLPGQTMDSWKATVEHALSLIPQHLSCYGLKVEEGTPLAARVAQGEVLPDDDQQADLYLWTVGRLERAGYPQYEISNFAKPGFASRHNLRYWLTQPYIGFGPGAHSDFGGRRYSFVRDLDAYIQGVLQGGDIIDESEIIPKRERCGEYLMLRLRTVQGINEQEYRSTYFMDFAPLQARLEQFRAQGWAEQTDGRWHFTPKGFLLSNQLIGDLLERQEQAHWEDLVSRPRHDHLDQGCP